MCNMSIAMETFMKLFHVAVIKMFLRIYMYMYMHCKSFIYISEIFQDFLASLYATLEYWNMASSIHSKY